MGVYNAAVITTAGEGLIAQAVRGTEIQWTYMRSSSTTVTSDLKGMTAIPDVQQTAAITDALVYNNSTVQVTARFSNTGISAPYYIRTVGIFAQLAGGAETLVAVMTAVTPDEVPAYNADSPSAFIFINQLAVQDASSITMTVTDTGAASIADLDRKIDKVGGDLSDTVAASATASSAAYPIPAAGDSFKVILGKVIKFFTDIKAAVVGLSISGRTITWTKADGTTGTLTTQDTTYGEASTTAAGLMSAADKSKLNGIASGAQVNSVTGVKGNAESTYRTGNVNITPANIGAAAASHNHSASNINSGTLSADRLPTVPISKGGTGATTAAGARNALGLGNTTGALPVANGGTGATSAAAARTNLGLYGMASGTAAPTTSTCPSGYVYFRYE